MKIPPSICWTIEKAQYQENEIDISNLIAQSKLSSPPTVNVVSSSTEYFSNGEMKMERLLCGMTL